MARHPNPLIPLLIAASACSLGACDKSPPPVAFTDAQQRRIQGLSPLPALPPDPTNEVADDPAAAHLGQFLFFDRRLSSSGGVSCATCHDPEKGMGDGVPLAVGQGVGTRHSPSLFNVGHNRWFFWDGRADTLWTQALSPLENPVEMESTRTGIARLIFEDEELRAAYEDVFGPMPDLSDTSRFPRRAKPSPEFPGTEDEQRWFAMTEEDRASVNTVFVNVGKCLAAYQRRLVTGETPFDRYVGAMRTGDSRAMSRAMSIEAQRGLAHFIADNACFNCHNGPLLSDGEFHNNRVAPLDGSGPMDPGRHEGIALLLANEFGASGVHSGDPSGPRASMTQRVLRSPENWGRFKTPSLRNVELHPPFMHQGQHASLEEVIRHYATFEGALPPGHHAMPDPLLQPLDLTEQDQADLVAFLRSLTSDPPLDPALLEQPASPRYPDPSGAQ